MSYVSEIIMPGGLRISNHMIEKKITTKAAEYHISARWDSNKSLINVNLGINGWDWKKDASFSIDLEENGRKFNIGLYKSLYGEERWPVYNGNHNLIGYEIDYSTVTLYLFAMLADKKKRYSKTIDASGIFKHDITFCL